jgi:Uma2 family endonuclease
MGLPIISRWVTAAEFVADRAFEHGYYVLDGEAFEDMGNAQRLHENIKARLHAVLLRAIDRHEIKAMVFSETAYELNAYTVLIPDISIQLPERPTGGGLFQGAPEIAIEILSLATSRRELDRKARAYWAGGASAVWVIDSELRKAFNISATGEWNEANRIEIAGVVVADVASVLPEAKEDS